MPSAYWKDPSSHTWKQLKSIYWKDPSDHAWKSLKTGWWKQPNVGWVKIFSSGTFFPEARNSSAVAIGAEGMNVGIGMYGYRGSDTAGTYTFQWQYATGVVTQSTTWLSQTAANNSGTLTGTNVNTPYYYTDINDLSLIANASTAYKFYMRLRVIKGTETQFSQVVQIHKRVPSIKILTTKTATGGTAGGYTVNVASTTGITAGQYLNGVGIGNNNYVSSVTNSTTLSLIYANVSTVTGNDIVFDGPRVVFTRYTYVPGTGNVPRTWNALASYSSPASDTTPAYSFSFNNAKAPYVNELLQCYSAWTTTKVLTNDAKPDYYIYTYRSGSGVTIKDSRITDNTSPQTATNASLYTVQAGDVYSPITIEIAAYTSSPDSPTTLTLVTRAVSSGALTPPSTLGISYKNGALQFTWDAADGGNSNPIYYTVYVERSGTVVHTSAQLTSLSYSWTTSVTGSYRFQVGVSQSGSSPVSSVYSDYLLVQAPSPFTYSMSNTTNDPANQPGDFTIYAPVKSTTFLNRYDWTWSASSGATSYSDTIYRPNGTNSSYTPTTQPAYTDYWNIAENGSYRLAVTATQKTYNYFTVTWDKPLNTTAVSYKIVGVYYTNNYSNTYNINQNVEDVTSYTWTLPYNTDFISISSITAYSLPAQNPASLTTTVSTTRNAYGGVIGSKTLDRTDNLTFETVTAGTATLTSSYATYEVASPIGITLAGWTPDTTDSRWTFTYQWYRLAPYATNQPSSITGATSSTYTPVSGDLGYYVSCIVTGTLLNQSVTATTSSVQINLAPPSFSLSDGTRRALKITSVLSPGADTFYGTYDSTNTIPEFTGNSYTISSVVAGSHSVTLYAKKLLYFSGVPVVLTSNRSTTNTVTIAPAPQDTGVKKIVATYSNFTPNHTFYISTNGYIGYGSVPVNPPTSAIPSGEFLNVAKDDIVQDLLEVSEESTGFYVHYVGHYIGRTDLVLEYQAYFPWNTYTVHVYFIRNDLPSTYLYNQAWLSTASGITPYSTYSSSFTSYVPQLPTYRSTLTTVTSGNKDDGYTSFLAYGRFETPIFGTVTRTDFGWTVQVTNYSTMKQIVTPSFSYSFSAGATATATAAIDANGLITVSKLAASSYATLNITFGASNTGWYNSYGTVTGQAKDGAPATAITKPSLSGYSGNYTTSSPYKIEVGGVLQAYAGSYSSSYGTTTLSIVTTTSSWGDPSVYSDISDANKRYTITSGAPVNPANLYRAREMVMGTDGINYYFLSDEIYTAVANPPTITKYTPTLNTIKADFTLGTGSVTVYAYKDGVLDGTVTPSTSAGSYTFTGLQQNTSYNLTFRGANSQGYLSVTTSGSAQSTIGPVTATTYPSISGGTATGSTIYFSAGTYKNANTITTGLAVTTNGNTPTYGAFSGSVGTKSPDGAGYYYVTSFDSNPPPYIFATRDTVVGLDGNTYYFYSGGGATTGTSTVNIYSGSGAIVATLAAGTAPTFNSPTTNAINTWTATMSNYDSAGTYSIANAPGTTN